MYVSEWFQLNDAFTMYKKEKAENDRMLSETNDKLQKQLTELRSSHAKLMSRLEFGNKRFVGDCNSCLIFKFLFNVSSHAKLMSRLEFGNKRFVGDCNSCLIFKFLFNVFCALCLPGTRCSRILCLPSAERSLP